MSCMLGLNSLGLREAKVKTPPNSTHNHTVEVRDTHTHTHTHTALDKNIKPSANVSESGVLVNLVAL